MNNTKMSGNDLIVERTKKEMGSDYDADIGYGETAGDRLSESRMERQARIDKARKKRIEKARSANRKRKARKQSGLGGKNINFMKK